MYFVGFFAVGALSLGACGAVALIDRWVFEPFAQAAKNRVPLSQFALVDFFALFVLIQAVLPLACVTVTVWDSRSVAVVLCCLALAAAVWRSAIRVLNAAGIVNSWHRFAIATVVYPSMIVGPSAVIAALLYAWYAATIANSRDANPTLGVFMAAIATFLGPIAATLLMRPFARFARYVVARASVANDNAVSCLPVANESPESR
jgi:hypothetical protein